MRSISVIQQPENVMVVLGKGYVSDRYIAAHPLCEECKRQEKLTPAAEVHHILPLSRGGTHDRSNLMALCTPCHSAITARDGDRWGTQ